MLGYSEPEPIDDGRVPPEELVIETTFMPEGTSPKAKTGDRIRVHYVCRRVLFLPFVSTALTPPTYVDRNALF